MNRRTFLTVSGASALCCFLKGSAYAQQPAAAPAGQFKISLAEWSLNQTIRSKKLSHMDFPRVAREVYDIDCIELVDQLYTPKTTDQAYLAEFKKRADDLGVHIGLLMIDTNGQLAGANADQRKKAVEKTYPLLDSAKFFGCHTARINAWGKGSDEEMLAAMVESVGPLAEYAQKLGINLVIENHGGCSSDPAWLTRLMKAVNHPSFGTLPDFGNFPDEIDRYDAVEAMMPYAKAVSAKALGFTPDGECVETDYRRMMRIVRDGGYTGCIGIESEVEGAEKEADAILKTRDLLRKIFEEQARVKPIFNGKDLQGWTPVAGGEWNVQDGVLIGRNGRDWTTNPEKTGSWLRTDAQYGDFRLEFQYAINQGGNSGVFFRAGTEKNPAFTGYEMQIYDSAGKEPSKSGAGAIYDVAAPVKNRVRPAGEFNYVTILAKGKQIQVEMNGERVLDVELDRSARGYIGLQNHDDRSEVRFKNIRIEEL